MNGNNSQENLCQVYTGVKNLNCQIENLFLLEELGSPDQDRQLLKSCRKCGQVYKEVVWGDKYDRPYSHFYQIRGQTIDQCHCIGFLAPLEILKEEKHNEGDPMYYSWEKETRMKCRKCGKFYLERIAQSNYDGFYFQTYSKN